MGLLFLLVDGAEGLPEAAGGLPSSYQGSVLFVLAAGAAYLVLEWVGDLVSAAPRPLGASSRSAPRRVGCLRC